MSVIISILLWLGAISAGTYTYSEFDAIEASNSAQIQLIESNSELTALIVATTDPSVVTLRNGEEGDH